MAKIPDAARVALKHRLHTRHTERWPGLRTLTVRYRGDFAYLDATFTDEDDTKQVVGRSTVMGGR